MSREAVTGPDGGCRVIAPGVMVCSPRGYDYRTVRHCWTCKVRRRMLARWMLWYGDDLTCLTCGDIWQDGERLGRPLERGWREKRIAAAKVRWQAAMPERQARKAINTYVEAEAAMWQAEEDAEVTA